MTDRERLMELINKSFAMQYEMQRFLTAEYTADHLLANGVIVPPCKVGDLVYALWSVPTETKYVIYCAEVKKISQYKRNCRLATVFDLEPIEYRGRRREYQIDDFGKTVFLTKEEAEKALAERIGK